MNRNNRLAHVVGRLVIGLLIVVVSGIGVLASTGSAAPDNGRTSADCYIPKERPVKVKVKEGREAVLHCTDGKIEVSEGPIHGDGSGEAITAAETSGDFQNDVVVAEDYTPPSDTGADAYTGQATCVIQSELYDNSIAKIRITYWEQHLAWRWNTDRNKIIRTGAAYAREGFEAKTGWGYDGTPRLFLYQRTINASGKWTKQGMEGWQEFSLHGAYQHEHRIIQWVTRDGACDGENDFSGTIPGAAYQKFRSYKDPFERQNPS